MDDTTHELFLRLAGRVDDDLLADARELVAVGEDGHALELVTAALAADGTPLPPAVRAELVTTAAAARIDLDAETALAPAAPDTTAHRFSATAEADVPVVAAVRELPNRLRDGVQLRLSWRQTPAGPAPTPLPQPVLLVETAAGGRPGEVLAYQMGAAIARSGVHVAVEVLTSGRPLTGYHAAALRDSTPLSADAPPRAASPPEKVESVVAEVVQEVTASHRPAPPEEPPVHEERSGDLFAVDDEPAPRPVPMRTWQGGRRRRGFGEQVAEAEADDDVPEAADRGPLPSPVPLARRTRPRPAEAVADPLLDPLPDETGWSDEWASGDWAVGSATAPDGSGGGTADGPTAGSSSNGVRGPFTEAPADRAPTAPTGRPLDVTASATSGGTTALSKGTPTASTGRPSTDGPSTDAASTGRPSSSGPSATATSASRPGTDGPNTGAPATVAGRPSASTGAPATSAGRPSTGGPNTSFTGRPGAPAGPYQPTPAAHPQAAPTGAPQATPVDDTPVGSHALFTDPTPPANGTAAPRSPEDPARPAPERPTTGGPAHALAEPPTGPLPVVGQATGPLPIVSQPMAEALLKPEALARLSDADRELLTRLQAELAGGGPAHGAHGPNGNGPNGAAPA